MSEPRRELIRVRVSTDEKGRIEARAEAARRTVSDYVRDRALLDLNGQDATAAVIATSGVPVAVTSTRQKPESGPPEKRYKCRCPKRWAEPVMCPDCGWMARP